MKGFFLTFAFLLITTFGFSQNNQLLRGQVLSEDSIGIDMVNVLNLTHTYGTVTNVSGAFSIPVFTGDTLLFSVIQFKNIKVVVTDSIIEKGFITPVLASENINLNAIVLTPGFTMLDTASKTFGEIDMGLPFNTVPIEKSLSERKESYLTSKLSSQIIGALTGELKKLREIQSLEKEIALSEDVKTIFEDRFYMKLGIKKEEIYLFIESFMTEAKSKGLLHPNKRYALITFIKGKAEHYLENRSLESDSIFISD